MKRQLFPIVYNCQSNHESPPGFDGNQSFFKYSQALSNASFVFLDLRKLSFGF